MLPPFGTSHGHPPAARARAPPPRPRGGRGPRPRHAPTPDDPRLLTVHRWRLERAVGDLRTQDRWGGTLAWLGERVGLGRVHVFPGSHDFYNGELDREDKLKSPAEAAGARWARKSGVVLPGRRCVCCTLWTDMALGGIAVEVNAWGAEERMNEHRLVRLARDGYRRARAADTVAVHRDHRRWLEARLAAPFDGETVPAGGAPGVVIA